MATFGELKSGIAQAAEDIQRGVSTVAEAKQLWEQAQSTLAQITQGSAQHEAEQINAYLAQAVESVNTALQAADAAKTTADSFAAKQ